MNLENRPHNLHRKLFAEILIIDTYIGREFLSPRGRKELRGFREKLSLLEKYSKSEVNLLNISIAHRKQIEIVKKDFHRILKYVPFMASRDISNLCKHLLKIGRAHV